MSILRDITIKSLKSLENPEILLFVGARQVGKTTILKQIQGDLVENGKTTNFLNLEDPDYLKLLNDSPKNLLKIFPFNLNERTYLFIDEIQYLKDPSNFLKYYYDEYRDKIKLIVSGSSAFYIDNKFKDSLAGRKEIFYVRTLSFREFLRFKNEEELSKKDFGGLSLSEIDKIKLFYEEFIIYGGYPRVALSPISEKEAVLHELAFSYVKKDILEAGIRKDEIFLKLFKILASGIGGLVNSSELAATLGISKTAVDNYLYTMQKSFHICLLKPFFKNVRKELTKMPKVYFFDLGLRNFLINNFDSFAARSDKGVLLENAVFRQLIENHEEDQIKFWRTSLKNEVDFIVDNKEALEVKANSKHFNAGKYKLFLDNYPEMSFEIVTFDAKEKKIKELKVVEAWEV
ncbi:MAG: ATP-binding protein [Patescibacteria group bacterium]